MNKTRDVFEGTAASLARAGRIADARALSELQAAEGHQTGPPNSDLYRLVWDGYEGLASGVGSAYALRHIERDHVTPILDAATRGVLEGHDYVRGARDGREIFNPDFLRELDALGLGATTVPEEFGGLGMSERVLANLFLGLGRRGAMHASAIRSATGVIGPQRPVLNHGTAEQKERVLSAIAQGAVGFFSLTSVGAGVGAVGERQGQARKTEGGYLLNATLQADGDITTDGRRMWATGADYGNEGVIVLADHSRPGRKLMFLVELPSIDGENFKLLQYNRRAFAAIPNNGIELRDFFVPDSALIQFDGVKALFQGLNAGRAGLCPMYAGLVDFLLRQMLEWAKVRKTAGGVLLIETPNVRRALAETAAYRCGMEALGALLMQQIETGKDVRIEAAMAKAWATEAAYSVARRVQDSFGGFFFLEDHPVGRFLGELLVGVTFEGPNPPILGKALSDLLALHVEAYFTPLEPLMEAEGIDVVDLGTREGLRVAWGSIMSKEVYPGDPDKKIEGNEHPYRYYGRGLLRWILSQRRRVRRLKRDSAESTERLSRGDGMHQLAAEASFVLQSWPLRITTMMQRYGRKLLTPKFEGLMGVEATRLSDALAQLSTARWAMDKSAGEKSATSLLGRMLGAKIDGTNPDRTPEYWAAVESVLFSLEHDEFEPISSCPVHPALFSVPEAGSGEVAGNGF